MARWFRNSGFKTNTYFHRFANELEEAKKHGRDVYNCRHAKELMGDVSIKDMLFAAWSSFKEGFARRLSRRSRDSLAAAISPTAITTTNA